MGRYLIMLLIPILATCIFALPYVQEFKYYDIDMDREDYEMLAVKRFKPFLSDQQSVLNLQLIHELLIPVWFLYLLIGGGTSESKIFSDYYEKNLINLNFLNNFLDFIIRIGKYFY